MDDPFIRDHDAAELEIAGEFLTNWFPFLTRDLCDGCSQTLADRIKSLRPGPFFFSKSFFFFLKGFPLILVSLVINLLLTDRPSEESPDRGEQIEPSRSDVDSIQNPNPPGLDLSRFRFF